MDSSYLRLTHGAGGGWGTSLILLPSFWSRDRLQQGAPVEAAWRTDGADALLIVKGRVGGLAAVIEVRLLPPSDQGFIARVAARVNGRVSLDSRPPEAFKIATLSSLRVSAALWDACAVTVNRRDLVIPRRGWIDHAERSTTLALRGGTSAWKIAAPTIEIVLDRPTHCTGWVSQSVDPNDDNIGFWAGSDEPMSDWSYIVNARPEPPHPAV